MSVNTNRAIIKRFVEEVWNRGRLDLVEEFFDEDVIDHYRPGSPGLRGRKQSQDVMGMVRAALPDIHVSLDDVIAEGDRVVTRWNWTATHEGELLGVSATGKPITNSGTTIYRFANARIAEVWNFFDELGLMQQMGVVPTPEPT